MYSTAPNQCLNLDSTINLLSHRADGLTPLHAAAAAGCLPIVEHLLNNGAHVNCVSTTEWKKGYAPLHFAVEKGSEEAVTLLLSKGAHVDVKGEDGVTPLHIAAERGYASIAEGLLNHGACINSLTLKEVYTPLHFAIKGGHETVVKLFLQHGAKIDSQDKDGITVLHLAVQKGDLTIVEDVLKYCPDVNDRSNRSSLQFAVCDYGEEYEKIVEALLEYGINVNPEGANNPKFLRAAVEKGYLKVIEALLKYGADVNNSTFKEGFTPLHSAANNQQEEVAKLLISYGADINAQDKRKKTPIFYAIENTDLKITNLLLSNRANIKDNPELLNSAVEKGCVEIVEALLQHEADIDACDEYGRTALHCTTKCFDYFEFLNHNNQGEIAKLLLSKGANVDAQTKKGETPLHAACENDYTKVVEALLEYNANVNSELKSGMTPLHLSVQEGNKEITIMLLNKGANVNAEQKDRTTALHIATQEGRKDVVKVLLEYGAKVDSKNENDVTPLHLAARKGYQEIIESILKFGADINSRDKDGTTALHFASQGGHVKVVETLLEYGADINITSRNNHTPLDEALNHVIVEALQLHIVKMTTVNLYVSEKNLQSFEWSFTNIFFSGKCDQEMENMKSEKINNNLNISFYDILAKDTSSLAVCMRNENIVHVFKSGVYKTKFPIYASMIETSFKKGIQKKELLEQANKIFHLLFHTFPELPHDCTEKIFSYLSGEDLKNFNRCLQAS